MAKKNGITTKDAISIGVFSAIVIAIRMIFMILGGISPVVWYSTHFVDAILLGPIYMLLIAKVNKTGAVFIVSLITGIIFISASYVILFTSILCGIVSEFIIKTMRNKSKFWLILSYVVFCYGFIGDFILLWVSKDSFLSNMESQNFDSEYIETISTMVNAPMIIAVIVSIAIGSIVGGLFGIKLMNKHFTKAGLI